MGTVEITLTSSLARFADNQSRITAASGTWPEILSELTNRYPHLGGKLVDRSGTLLPFVNIYIGEDSLRDLVTRSGAEVPAGATITIMSAVAGG